MKRPSAKQLQAQVDRFNAEHPPGSRVIAWKGVRGDGPGIEGEVRSPAYVLSGHTAVVHVTGVSGSVALSHVSVLAIPADDRCPVCAEPFRADDICATDIELGTCHAECLEGSPVVDLDTGEELPDGKVDTYRYGETAAPEPQAEREAGQNG